MPRGDGTGPREREPTGGRAPVELRAPVGLKEAPE
ncbi:MAG: hypothetical protein A4E57_04577 [Syntrophorhabdaceae bacterium PtaU1.Bin034]|nr:MAG: hypothetical protein A4E57_04577 [Syntrophorhabdaceae bacterium PtaU1.Bin034]